MGNELMVSGGANLAQGWTQDDYKLIKETVAKGTSDSEFKLFIYTATKYNLDPLVKRIWCVKYEDAPASIFAGRDGFLSIAHSSGHFDGMESGVRTDGGELIGWCKVYRKDMSHPFVVEIPASEYNTNQFLWKTKPRTMIQKVAESQCLRRAFDISGIYSPEEMPEQGNGCSSAPIAKPFAAPVSKPKEEPKEQQQEITPEQVAAKFSGKVEDLVTDGKTDAAGTDIGIVDRIAVKTGKSKKGEWKKTAVKKTRTTGNRGQNCCLRHRRSDRYHTSVTLRGALWRG